MPRLTSAEISAYAAKLRQPQSTTFFGEIVDELSETLGFWSLVQDTPFRDTHVAREFAKMRKAKTVRLGADPPDFHLTGVKGCDTFEIVETYSLGRKRSDEYRQLALADDKRGVHGEASLNADERALFKPVSDPFEDWEPRSLTAMPLLKAAAISKSKQAYPREWGLIINLDLGGFVHSDDAVVAQMASATAMASTAFHEVWVLWGRSARLVWRGGLQRLE